jgi:hypothetical protein
MRIPDDEWEAYGEIAEQLNSNRTRLTRDFIQWLRRDPGAKMPKRPTEQEPTP